MNEKRPRIVLSHSLSKPSSQEDDLIITKQFCMSLLLYFTMQIDQDDSQTISATNVSINVTGSVRPVPFRLVFDSSSDRFVQGVVSSIVCVRRYDSSRDRFV